MAEVSFSEEGKPQTTYKDPEDRLDDLLATYLRTLDTYTSSRSTLHTKLSDGFLDLASANFTAQRRYGEDFYDERMKAQVIVKRTEIKEKQVDIASPFASDDDAQKLDPQASSSDVGSSDRDAKMQALEKPRDPILQYGAFINPTLRRSQSAFQATLPSIAELINAIHSLNELGNEIGRTRKTLARLQCGVTPTD
ncbi:MAG: hypothetical protein Q9159_003984 [Coniocarpon cinnabarinum]